MAKAPALDSAPARVRAAQYLRMSTEHQTYSIDNQRDAIREYANVMNYDIVATYQDAGRSGLNFEGRAGLQRLLADVESKQANFETIIVYDVSRWGRFQNIDESASYEYRCQMAGVRIEFCAEQFANDGSIGSDVLKAIKRSMAAEHSRMLSQKVFIGQSRLIRLGFHQGGRPGFGLRRLLVDQSGREKAILASGEYKSIQTDRVVLVPGPPDEVATVRWIFSHFVRLKKTELEIARALNKRGVVTDLNRPWKRESVHQVITNEKYVGNSVWNRRSYKLQTKFVFNHPSQWVRHDGAFAAIVDAKLFRQAQKIAKARTAPISNQEMLMALKKLVQRHGRLSGAIIDAAPGCALSSLYKARFGTLRRAYALVDYIPPEDYRFFDINDRLRTLRREAIQNLLADVKKVDGFAQCDDGATVIRINGEFTVSLVIARCRWTAYGYPRWRFAADRQPAADITVVMRMNADHATVRDYLVAPTSELAEGVLAARNGIGLDVFFFPTLEPLTALAARIDVALVADAASAPHVFARGWRPSGKLDKVAQAFPKRRYGWFSAAELLKAHAEDLLVKGALIRKSNAIQDRLRSICDALGKMTASATFRELLEEQGLAAFPKSISDRIGGREPLAASDMGKGPEGIVRRPSFSRVRQVSGVCSEAVDLLEDSPVPDEVFAELQKMIPVRQVEAARMLLAMDTLMINPAKLLVAVTPQSQLLAVRRPTKVAGLTDAVAKAIERRSADVNRQFWMAANRQGYEHLEVVAATAYLTRLLQNVRVVMYLARKFPELLAGLQMAMLEASFGTEIL